MTTKRRSGAEVEEVEGRGVVGQATSWSEEGDDALVGSLVKEAAIRRVHGFEILPAPFVVAHLLSGTQ